MRFARTLTQAVLGSVDALVLWTRVSIVLQLKLSKPSQDRRCSEGAPASKLVLISVYLDGKLYGRLPRIRGNCMHVGDGSWCAVCLAWSGPGSLPGVLK
jgi:hypothetical protein